MREYLDKKVRLSVDIDGKILYFSGRIIGVSSDHLTFIDKFDKQITKRIKDIVEIEELRE